MRRENDGLEGWDVVVGKGYTHVLCCPGYVVVLKVGLVVVVYDLVVVGKGVVVGTRKITTSVERNLNGGRKRKF